MSSVWTARSCPPARRSPQQSHWNGGGASLRRFRRSHDGGDRRGDRRDTPGRDLRQASAKPADRRPVRSGKSSTSTRESRRCRGPAALIRWCAFCRRKTSGRRPIASRARPSLSSAAPRNTKSSPSAYRRPKEPRPWRSDRVPILCADDGCRGRSYRGDRLHGVTTTKPKRRPDLRPGMAVADDIARSDRGDPLLRPLSPVRRRRICPPTPPIGGLLSFGSAVQEVLYRFGGREGKLL